MKLTSQDRLKFLSRQVSRAEAALAELRTRTVEGLLRPGIPRSQLETAEEALATAEALLLLAAERDLLWQNVSADMKTENVETLVSALPIPAAEKS